MQIYKNLSLEKLPGEEWLPITDYPGYEISNLGRVKSYSKSTAQMLRQGVTPKGYTMVSLGNMSGRKSFKVHRLTGVMFIPNHNGYKELNHIDSDKTNNAASNLEWCSRSYNMRHMLKEQGPGHRLGMSNPKAVILMHKDYGTFYTIREAAELHGCTESNMSFMVNEFGYRKNKTKFIIT